MAKLVPPLNDTQIKNAKPQVKEYNLGDGHGLTLRIKSNGTKLWRFNYQRPITPLFHIFKNFTSNIPLEILTIIQFY